jgi:hypothetical protein
MDPIAQSNPEQFPPTWDRWLDVFRLLVKHGAHVFETVRERNLAELNVERNNRPSRTSEYLRILVANDSPQLEVALGRRCWSALNNALHCKSDVIDALKLLRGSGVNLSKFWTMAERPSISHVSQIPALEPWTTSAQVVATTTSTGEINLTGLLYIMLLSDPVQPKEQLHIQMWLHYFVKARTRYSKARQMLHTYIFSHKSLLQRLSFCEACGRQGSDNCSKFSETQTLVSLSQEKASTLKSRAQKV